MQLRQLHPREGDNPGIHLHEEEDEDQAEDVEEQQQAEQREKHHNLQRLANDESEDQVLPGGRNRSNSSYQSNFDLFADLSFKVDNSPGIVKHLAQTLGLMGVTERKEEEEREREKERDCLLYTSPSPRD